MAVATVVSSLTFMAIATPPAMGGIVAELGHVPATSGGYIVVLKDVGADRAIRATDEARRHGAKATSVFTHALRGYSADLTDSQVAAVGADPAVQFIAADRNLGTPTDPTQHSRTQNGIPSLAGREPLHRCTDGLTSAQCLPRWADRIDVEKSAAIVGPGRRPVQVNVAIIDSGIAGDHPDLNVRGGVDCSTGTAATPGSSLTDSLGHGTAVAGIIGAKDNQVGIIGAAPGAPLWSAKVSDSQGNFTLSSVLCAIDWVTSTRQNDDRADAIAVANISLGFDGSDDGRCGLANHDALHLAICKSTASGVTYVADAGNDGKDLATLVPAAYREVLTATAIADFDGRPGALARPDCYGVDLQQAGEGDDTAASFSNFAVSPIDHLHTIGAPGVCLETTVPPTQGLGGYFVVSGTSFAAPAVAGTLAICIAHGGCRSGKPYRNILELQARTAVFNLTHPAFGFRGDPLRPIPGRYYGFLLTATPY
jgi:subtilisin